MKLRSFILALLASGAATQVSAQYTEDAFRFSGTENSTSARFNGLGGQQTSLGGDLSSLYGNPAGLGMFSRSEFSLSTSFINNSNKAEFLGTNNKSSFLNPNINNIGVVFHSPVAKTGSTTKGLLSLNFGIGYQKTNFFRNDLEFGGITNGNGLGTYFTDVANGEDQLADNLTNAAYVGYLLEDETDPPNGYYVNNTQSGSSQYQTLKNRGGQSNFDLSLGLNFSNTFYLGFGLGIASVNYRSEQLLRESGFYEDNGSAYNADLLYSYDTKGSGVNFKVGAILKPVQELRLGLSLETPTYYNLDDNYYERIDIGSTNDDNSFPINYDLRTPLKLNAGISYIIGNKGLISADVSYRDYSTTHFTSDTDVQTDRTTNQQLNTWYKEVVNYGVGAEYKLTNDVALRAGYRFIADPNNGLDRDYAVNRYSGGIGYKFGNYFIDGAVQFNDLKSDYAAYNLNGPVAAPRAIINNNVTNVSITFGARF
jgi:opacity protein-like surface antigen